LDTVISACALIISLISLGLSVHFWRRSFRPLVTASVRTHSAGNVATIFDLEVLNSGSLPAKNIRLKAEDADIHQALGNDANDENKRRWLCCFEADSVISVLHNNEKIRCSFGTSRPNDEGFWRYKSTFPITIEYEGWFGEKYIQNQKLQIIDSESFTGFLWS
jgi:hypothetical protein